MCAGKWGGDVPGVAHFQFTGRDVVAFVAVVGCDTVGHTRRNVVSREFTTV